MAKTKKVTLGSRVTAARKAQKLSQSALARKVGCAPSYINLIENNHRNPRLPFLAMLAVALDVPAAKLLGD